MVSLIDFSLARPLRVVNIVWQYCYLTGIVSRCKILTRSYLLQVSKKVCQVHSWLQRSDKVNLLLNTLFQLFVYLFSLFTVIYFQSLFTFKVNIQPSSSPKSKMASSYQLRCLCCILETYLTGKFAADLSLKIFLLLYLWVRHDDAF